MDLSYIYSTLHLKNAFLSAYILTCNFLFPFFKVFFQRATLGLQQNWEDGIEISHRPLPPQSMASPIINIIHRSNNLLPRMNLLGHTMITQSP